MERYPLAAVMVKSTHQSNHLTLPFCMSILPAVVLDLSPLLSCILRRLKQPWQRHCRLRGHGQSRRGHRPRPLRRLVVVGCGRGPTPPLVGHHTTMAPPQLPVGAARPCHDVSSHLSGMAGFDYFFQDGVIPNHQRIFSPRNGSILALVNQIHPNTSSGQASQQYGYVIEPHHQLKTSHPSKRGSKQRPQ